MECCLAELEKLLKKKIAELEKLKGDNEDVPGCTESELF